MGKIKLLRGYVDARVADLQSRLDAIEATCATGSFDAPGKPATRHFGDLCHMHRDPHGKAVDGWIKTQHGTVRIGERRRYTYGPLSDPTESVAEVIDIDGDTGNVTLIDHGTPGAAPWKRPAPMVAMWPLDADVPSRGNTLEDNLCEVLGMFVGEDGKSVGALETLERITAELRERRVHMREIEDVTSRLLVPEHRPGDGSYAGTIKRIVAELGHHRLATVRQDARITELWIACEHVNEIVAPFLGEVPGEDDGVVVALKRITNELRDLRLLRDVQALAAEGRALQPAADRQAPAPVERGQSRVNAAGDVVRISAGSMGEPKTFVVHRVVGELLLKDGVPVLEDLTADVIAQRWPIRIAGTVIDADTVSPADQQAVAKPPRRSAAVAAQQCRMNEDGDVIRVEEPFRDGWSLRGIVGKDPPSTWSTEAILERWPFVLADTVQRIKRIPSDTKLNLAGEKDGRDEAQPLDAEAEELRKLKGVGGFEDVFR